MLSHRLCFSALVSSSERMVCAHNNVYRLAKILNMDDDIHGHGVEVGISLNKV